MTRKQAEQIGRALGKLAQIVIGLALLKIGLDLNLLTTSGIGILAWTLCNDHEAST